MPVPAENLPWHIPVGIWRLQRPQAGRLDADHLVHGASPGLLDPGHPGPPGAVPLVPFPPEQMPSHAIAQLNDQRRPRCLSSTTWPVCEDTFDTASVCRQRVLRFRRGRAVLASGLIHPEPRPVPGGDAQAVCARRAWCSPVIRPSANFRWGGMPTPNRDCAPEPGVNPSVSA